MRKIEKPELISTIRDKKKVWLNIRESRLNVYVSSQTHITRRI